MMSLIQKGQLLLLLTLCVCLYAECHLQGTAGRNRPNADFVELLDEDDDVENAMNEGKVACYCHGDPSTWFAAQGDGWMKYKDAKMEEEAEAGASDDDDDSLPGDDGTNGSSGEFDFGDDSDDQYDDDSASDDTPSNELLTPVNLQLASAVTRAEEQTWMTTIHNMPCKCVDQGKDAGPPLISQEGAMELNGIVGLDDEAVNDMVDKMECKNGDPYENNLGGWAAFMKRYIEESSSPPVSIAMRKKVMTQETSPEFREFVGRMERLEGLPNFCVKVVNDTSVNGTAHNMTTSNLGAASSAPPPDDDEVKKAPTPKVLPQDQGATATLQKTVADGIKKKAAGDAGKTGHGSGDGNDGDDDDGMPDDKPATAGSAGSSEETITAAASGEGGARVSLLGKDPDKCFGNDEVGKFLEQMFEKSLKWKSADEEKVWGDCIFWSRWVKSATDKIKMFKVNNHQGTTRALDIVKCICPSAVALNG